jgi:hypothetical protein
MKNLLCDLLDAGLFKLPHWSEGPIAAIISAAFSDLSHLCHRKQFSLQLDHLAEIDILQQELIESKLGFLDEIETTAYLDTCDTEIFHLQIQTYLFDSGVYQRLLDQQFRARQIEAAASIANLRKQQDLAYESAVANLTNPSPDPFDVMSGKLGQIAHDRRSLYQLWVRKVQDQVDANKNLWLDLSLEYECLLEARVRNAALQAAASSVDLQRDIAHLEREASQAATVRRQAANALDSQLRVQLMDLREAFGQRMERLKDHREGLLGMLNERIEVLQDGLVHKDGPPPPRELALTNQLTLLSTRLGIAQEKLWGMRPSRSNSLVSIEGFAG